MAEVLTTMTDITTTDEGSGCFHLTYSERIIGFGITAACAFFAGILSIVALFILNLRKFSVLFSVSTILFFVSLGLLVGCKRLLSSCSDKKRLISSLCLIFGMLFTLFFGAIKRSIILSIIGLAIETLSYLYFALSYIPGGTRLFHLLIF